MANGDMKLGIVSAGSIQTASNNAIICSWSVPSDITARVEVDCLIQSVLYLNKSSYTIIATIRTNGGNLEIKSGPTNINIMSSTIMTVNLDIDGNNLNIITANTDGNFHRITAFIRAYSVEQQI